MGYGAEDWRKGLLREEESTSPEGSGRRIYKRQQASCSTYRARETQLKTTLIGTQLTILLYIRKLLR